MPASRNESAGSTRKRIKASEETCSSTAKERVGMHASLHVQQERVRPFRSLECLFRPLDGFQERKSGTRIRAWGCQGRLSFFFQFYKILPYINYACKSTAAGGTSLGVFCLCMYKSYQMGRALGTADQHLAS
jgi:hypothetical protein